MRSGYSRGRGQEPGRGRDRVTSFPSQCIRRGSVVGVIVPHVRSSNTPRPEHGEEVR